MTVRQPAPDPFQVALANLAGLDPENLLNGSVSVELDRSADGKTTAIVYARAAVPVDPDEVVRLAMEHDRIRSTQ